MGKAPAGKTLGVFIHLAGDFVPAGLLTLLEQSGELLASRFSYGLRYLDRHNAAPIDPVSLPIHGANAPEKGTELFPAEGLVLFGGIRDAAPDGWGRRVIESRLQAPLNSLPESTYLLEAGSERAGALDVRPSIGSVAKAAHGASIQRLDCLLQAAERIEDGLPVPGHLEDFFDAGSSMGGMRPKATVLDAEGNLWLAKFPARSDTSINVPVIEAATMQLAKEAGLNVPPLYTEVLGQKLGQKTVMLIRRFDRVRHDGRMHRRHMVSALTLLGCHESESPQRSYGDIADRIRRYGVAERIASDQEELFGRMVFNIFVTNDDDHLRNHAFLWDGEHQGWALSPLYDVMPRPMLATQRNLHLGIGAQGRLATLDNALSAYARFGLTRVRAEEIIDRIWRVVRQWRTYFEGFGVPGGQIEKIASAFRHIDEIRGE